LAGGSTMGFRERTLIGIQSLVWWVICFATDWSVEDCRNSIYLTGKKRGLYPFILPYAPLPIRCNSPLQCEAKSSRSTKQSGWITSRRQSFGFENWGHNGDSKPVC